MERRECAAPRSTIKHLIRDSLKKHCGGVAGCPIKTMYKIWGGSKRINLEKHDDAIKEAIAELKAKNLLTEEKDVFKMKVSFILVIKMFYPSRLRSFSLHSSTLLNFIFVSND